MQQQSIHNVGPGRMNQATSANILGQTYLNTAPVTRYVDSTAAYKSVRQNITLAQSNTQYALCPQLLPQYQYSPQLHQQIYYVLREPLQHQQPVINSTNITLNNAPITSFGAPRASVQQRQVLYRATPVLAKTRLGVINIAKVKPVEVISTVSIPRQTLPQQQTSKKKKLRSRALRITDPVTGRNILDDLEFEQNISEPPDVLSKSAPKIHSPIKSTINKDPSLDLEIDIKSLSWPKFGKTDINIDETSELLIDDASELPMNTEYNKLESIIDEAADLLIDEASELPMNTKYNKSQSAIYEASELPIRTKSNKLDGNYIDESSELPMNTKYNKSESIIDEASELLLYNKSVKLDSNYIDEASILPMSIKYNKSGSIIDETSELLLQNKFVKLDSIYIDEASILPMSIQYNKSGSIIDETSELLLHNKFVKLDGNYIDEAPKLPNDNKSENIIDEASDLLMGSVQREQVSTHQTGKRQANIRRITDAPRTTAAICKVPQSLISQPVPPQQEQSKRQPQEQNISLQSFLPMPNDNSISRQGKSKESCMGNHSATTENKKPAVLNYPESVKIKNFEKNENFKLTQQRQLNIPYSKEKRWPKQNLNFVAAETNLNEACEKVINKYDSNNNNTANKNIYDKRTTATKTDDKLCKKQASYFKKHYKTHKSVWKRKSETNDENKSSTCSTKERLEMKYEDTDKKYNDSKTLKDNKQSPISITSNPDGGLENKETIDNRSSTISNTSNVHQKSVASNQDLILEHPTTAKKQEDVSVAGAVETKVSSNESQWSPSNPCGKKQYTWKQLMQLCQVKASRARPNIKYLDIVSHTNVMPSFATAVNASGYTSHCRNTVKHIINLSLYLDEDVKLNTADNAWRPRLMTSESPGAEIDPDVKAQREKEELIRRVRGILNKLTPEKFEPLVEEIITLNIDTMEKMEAVMILVFEKAIDEPVFSVSYASLCQRLTSVIKARDEGAKSNLAAFHRSLLVKAQFEFDQNVTQNKIKEEKLLPIKEKIKGCTNANERAELKALLEEEERKIRRRFGGTVRFIGELFKLSMLTGKIMNFCINTLLKDPNNEDMLECLCKILTTIGEKFEQTDIPNSNDQYSLQSVIQRMQHISTNKKDFKLSSRIRFMLLDVIDLRIQKWQLKRSEIPKTMEQIEQEANKEKMATSQYYGEGFWNEWNDHSVRNFNKNSDDRHSHSSDNLKRQQGESGSLVSTSWSLITGKGNRFSYADSTKYY